MFRSCMFFTRLHQCALFYSLNSPQQCILDWKCVRDHSQKNSDFEAHKLFSRPRERHHVNKGYDCCRRQTDMARRYPDDDPLRHVSSHSVALTVGLSVQSYYQHEIPAKTKASAENLTTTAFKLCLLYVYM